MGHDMENDHLQPPVAFNTRGIADRKFKVKYINDNGNAILSLGKKVV